MLNLVVVNNPKHWNFNIPDVEIVSAKTYLTDSRYSEIRTARVYNLCRAYRYQEMGYYVSLLAEARGHRSFPSVTTIQDMKSLSILRGMSDEIDQLIQNSFSKLKSKQFKFNIYFGNCVDKLYEKLGHELYNLFQTPLLEAVFIHHKKWILQNVNPVPFVEIPEKDVPYVIEFANSYFSRKRIRLQKKVTPIYDLAILVDQNEKLPPSNKKAINYFIKAGESLGFRTRLITRNDFSRLSEFDALFIRERTEVDHHTYRFARRAYTENMVVLDDPESILKCTNKVYLAELLIKAKVPIPRTVITHKDNKDEVANMLGLPCVLKQPDGSFSSGVIKVKTREELKHEIDHFLNSSDLIIAQEYIPTKFDWRIAFLDRKPLFACKYYMAKNHWQIVLNGKKSIYGSVEAIPLDKIPKKVLQLADKAAGLIGDGLYGVDLKQLGDKVVVIEVNDNPDIHANYEDKILKDELYLIVMQSILQRIENKKQKLFLKK